MKKCIICLALICLILGACASASDLPTITTNAPVLSTGSTATTAQPTILVTTTAPATVSTTVPTTKVTTRPTTVTTLASNETISGYTTKATTRATTPGTPGCFGIDHTYQYGHCIYCGVKDNNYNPCVGGHVYQDGWCIYCLEADPNYDPCADGHIFENGFCIMCLAVDPSLTKPTTSVSSTTISRYTTKATTRTTTLGTPGCFGIDHTYQYGHCIYCGVKDNNYNPCVVGHVYQDGWCIYCLEADPNYDPCADGHIFENGFCIMCLAVDPSPTKPTTSVSSTTISRYTTKATTRTTTLGTPGCFGIDHTYQYGHCIYCGVKDNNYNPCVGGHVYQDGWCIYCLVADPNYDPCADGHIFENGFCIMCLAVDPSPTKPTTSVSSTTISRYTTKATTRPKTWCILSGHEYINGTCRNCGKTLNSTASISTTRRTTKPTTASTSTPISSTRKPTTYQTTRNTSVTTKRPTGESTTSTMTTVSLTTVPTTHCMPTTIATTTNPTTASTTNPTTGSGTTLMPTSRPMISVYSTTTLPPGVTRRPTTCGLPRWEVLRGYDAYREYLTTRPENSNSYWLYYYENLPYIGEINYVQIHPWERNTKYKLNLRVDGTVSVGISNAGVITCYGTEYTGTGEDLRTVDKSGSTYRIVGAFVYRYSNGELSAVVWVYNGCKFTLSINGSLAPENLHPFMNDLLNTETVDRAWQAIVTAAEQTVN